jgi:hypothetical protein
MSITLLEKHTREVLKHKNRIDKLNIHNKRINENINGIERRQQKSKHITTQLRILYQKKRNNFRILDSLKISFSGIEGRIRGINNELSVRSLLNQYLFYGNNIICIQHARRSLYFYIDFGVFMKSMDNKDAEYDAIIHPIEFNSIYKKKKTSICTVHDVVRNRGIIIEIKCKFRLIDCIGPQYERRLHESKHTKVIYVCNHADIINSREITMIDNHFAKLRKCGYNIHIIHRNTMLIDALMI